MKPSTKMSGEERREAIITAVRRVFADKGFDRTTTRELAQAAGVSEALLFKHFPNKEALFSAMQVACCGAQDLERCQRIYTMEPGTGTLVLLVHFLVDIIVDGRSAAKDDKTIQHRLLLRSLAEGGEFARLLVRKLELEWMPKFKECVRAAILTGDALEGPVRPAAAGWFVHHLAAAVMMHTLPGSPVVDYGIAQEDLVSQAVWFVLRGIGLKESAIKKYCNTKFLARFAM